MDRLAYLIGIDNYENWGKLKNPKNDVICLSECLKKANFEVKTGINLNKKDLDSAIWEFKINLTGKKVGLFYFAGHGVEINGEQYLIPLDGKKSLYDKEVGNEIIGTYINVTKLINEMSDAPEFVGIFILDCCREKLYPTELPKYRGIENYSIIKQGMFVSFSTGPNLNASDGTDGNGLFMKSLKEYILDKDNKIEDIFKKVRCDVIKESNSRQIPWEHSSLTTDFYFVDSNIEKLVKIKSINDRVKEIYYKKLDFVSLKKEIQKIFLEENKEIKVEKNEFIREILNKMDDIYIREGRK